MRVFVSYSRVDKDLVAPIASVLRISTDIFRDEDDITPGKRWNEEIEKSLLRSRVVLVFWSRAASESQYVESEYTSAIANGKDVVPILLDDTPLASPLNQYQWLDFRPFLRAAALRGLKSAYYGAKSYIPPFISILGSIADEVARAAVYARLLSETQLEFVSSEAEEMRTLFDARLGTSTRS